MTTVHIFAFACVAVWVLLRLLGFAIRAIAHPVLTIYELVVFVGNVARVLVSLGVIFLTHAYFTGKNVQVWLIVALAVGGITFHLVKTYLIDPAMYTLLDHGGLINLLAARPADNPNF